MAVFDEKYFFDEEAAYAFIESRIWPHGRRCPHCGVIGRSGPLSGQSTRLGTYKCYACRKPFTVKIGTIFEGSHIPLHIWLRAIFMLSSAKEPFSANQLHRILGISVKSALYLLERIGEGGGAEFVAPLAADASLRAMGEQARLPVSPDKPGAVATPGATPGDAPDQIEQRKAILPFDLSGRMRWKHSASRIRLSHAWQGPGQIRSAVAIHRPAAAAIHFKRPMTETGGSAAPPEATQPVEEPVKLPPRQVPPKPRVTARPKSARGLLHSDSYLPGGIPIAPLPGDGSAVWPQDSGNAAYRTDAELLPSAAAPSRLSLSSPLPESFTRGSRDSLSERPLPEDFAVAIFESRTQVASYQWQAQDALHLSLPPDVWRRVPTGIPAAIPSRIADEPWAPIPEIRTLTVTTLPPSPLPGFGGVPFVPPPRGVNSAAAPAIAQLIWWIATGKYPVPVHGHGDGLYFPYPTFPRSTPIPDSASLHAPSAVTACEPGFVPEAGQPEAGLKLAVEHIFESTSAPQSDAAVSEWPWQPIAFDTQAKDDVSAAPRILASPAADIDLVSQGAMAPPGIEDRALTPSGRTPAIPEHAVWATSIAAIADRDSFALSYVRTPVTADGYAKDTLLYERAPIALNREYATAACDSDIALGSAIPVQSLAMAEREAWQHHAGELSLLPPQGPGEVLPELVRMPVAVFAWQSLRTPSHTAAIDIAYHANDNRGRAAPEVPVSPPPRFWARARQRLGLALGKAPLHQIEISPAEREDRAIAVAARATDHETESIPAPTPFTAPSAVLFRFAELSAAVGLMEGPVMGAAAATLPVTHEAGKGVVLLFSERVTEASEDWAASAPAGVWQEESGFPVASADAAPGPGAKSIPQPLALELLDYRPPAAQHDEYALAPALHDGEVLRREIPQERARTEDEEEVPAYLVPPLPFAAKDAQAPTSTQLDPPVAAGFTLHAESTITAPEPVGSIPAGVGSEAPAPASFIAAPAANEDAPQAELAAPLPDAGEYFEPASAFTLAAAAAGPGPKEDETLAPNPGTVALPAASDQPIAGPQPVEYGVMPAAAVPLGAPVAGLVSEPAIARLDSPAPVTIPPPADTAGSTLPGGELPEIPVAPAAAATAGAAALASATAQPQLPAAQAELPAAGSPIRPARGRRAQHLRQAAVAGAIVLLGIIAITAQQLLNRMHNGNSGQAPRNRVTPNGGRAQANAPSTPNGQAAVNPAPVGNSAAPAAPGAAGAGSTSAPPSGVQGGPSVPPSAGGATPPQTPPPAAPGSQAASRPQGVAPQPRATAMSPQPPLLARPEPATPGPELAQVPGATQAPSPAPVPVMPAPIENPQPAQPMTQTAEPMALGQQVEQQFPLRARLGYGNTGLPVLGRDQWTAGLDIGSEYSGNARLSYQYTSNLPLWRSLSGASSPYQMHSANVDVPLPWRDRLTVFASYATAVPNFGPDIGKTANSWQLSGRYILSLPETAAFHQQLRAGFDFESNNSNVLFGGLQVFGVTSEIDQFSAGYSFSLRDAIGETAADGTLVVSPGGMSPGNTDNIFSQQQPFAQARYTYARLDATRLTGLPQDAEWVKNLGWLGGTTSLTRIAGQWASKVLLPAEQLGIGGLDTVPGYNERTANGSTGIVLNEELLTPAFGILRHFLPTDPGDLAQLSGFLAYGSVRNQKPQAGTENDHDLMSAGFGAHYHLGHYVNFRFVYGWQLRAVSGVPAAEAPSGGQLGEFTVTLSYP